MNGNWLMGDIAITRIAAHCEFDVTVRLYRIGKSYGVARYQTNRKAGTHPTTQMWHDYERHQHLRMYYRAGAAMKFYQDAVAEMVRVFGNGRLHFHEAT